ncbi:MAG TPA: hypothetical protein VFF98_04050 [Novosphingobium sp.]|nr:hypothetical protein [Novosphingobium sp.]HZV09711.1 hypothetical protein [Novosphingobium sp.]
MAAQAAEFRHFLQKMGGVAGFVLRGLSLQRGPSSGTLPAEEFEEFDEGRLNDSGESHEEHIHRENP